MTPIRNASIEPDDPQADTDRFAEKAHLRRRQVLDAAAQCFREYGFHGTSIVRISQVAGMSPGHIYHYFRNKEAIVAGIVEQNIQEVLGRMRAIRQASEKVGVVEACLAEAEAGVAMRSEKAPASLNLEILAEATRNPAIGDSIRQADALMRRSVRELFLELPSMRRLPRGELEARITVVNTLFDGLSIRTLLDPALDQRATSKVIKQVIRHLLEGGR